MSALDRRWVRWLVRLIIFVASVPAAFLLAYFLALIFQGGTLSHGDLIVVVMIWPILTLFLWVIGHFATTHWPRP
jgi:hypothetical protein